MNSRPTFQLRPANAADAQAILSVHTESLMVLCAGDYTPQQLAGWAKLPVDERWLPRKFERGDVVLIAEDERGTVIGFGERTGEEIRAVYVHPLHARRGVGAMLLRELERSAVAAGIENLRLDSSVTAEGFYRRHGFVGDGREIHDCGNGTKLECVRMSKSLRLLPPREATAAHVPAIFEIRTAVRENAMTLEQLAAVGITPESVLESLGKSRHGWVIENAVGDVVAFAMVDVQTNTIMGLFTHPGWQGRGCGSALLEVAVRFLFDRGAKLLWLTTGRETAAVEFYRRHGWVGVNETLSGELRLGLERKAWAG